MFNNMKNIALVGFFTLFIITGSFAQFGIGMTVSNDLYNRYQNPQDEIAYEGSGSFLFNLGVGPKIWLGGEDFSVSAEAQATIGLFGLAIKDYKGLGNASFPLIGRLNFGGLSGLNKEFKFGWSIGGGLQFNRTELYYVKGSFKDDGGQRDFFKTYVGEIAYGIGISGFTAAGILRIGYDSETKANTFNIGLQYDFNIPKLKDISNPASAL